MTAPTTTERMSCVAVDKIRPCGHQPRREFRPEDLEELTASIRAVGLLQPPLVREVPGTDFYELIAGERRWRACMRAGLTEIPVVLFEGQENDVAEAALVENVQRVDLNPIEIAKALKDLHEKFGLSQEDLAQRISKKRSTVANYLRLLSLPREIQEALRQGGLTMGHAKVILSVQGEDARMALFRNIVAEKLTVRKTEVVVEKKKEPTAADVHLEALAERLQHTLGTHVTVSGSGVSGKIVIDYYNLDDLDRLLNLFQIGL